MIFWVMFKAKYQNIKRYNLAQVLSLYFWTVPGKHTVPCLTFRHIEFLFATKKHMTQMIIILDYQPLNANIILDKQAGA